MRRSLLIALGVVGLLNVASSQTRSVHQSKAALSLPAQRAAYAHPQLNERVSENVPMARPTLPILAENRTSTDWEQTIGITIYDNQTNNSTYPRINVDNLYVGACWTQSLETTTFTDRGTGFNKSADYGMVFGDIPSAREESYRSGFPSLALCGNGTEIVVNHDGGGELRMLSRQVGTSAWDETTIPDTLSRDILWPRTAVGGSDNNTLHVIAVAIDNTTAATPFLGMNYPLAYWRSLDAGVTWDQQSVILPGIDSIATPFWTTDSYAIDAKGDNVSIAVFGEFGDTFVLNSSDNGATWTKTIVNTFPIHPYQYDSLSDGDGDGVADTLLVTDGNGSVLIDNSGIVHMFFGEQYLLDDTPGDGFYSFFNGFNLLYWNSTMASDSILILYGPAESANDGDATFTVTLTQIASYLSSLASMPTSGIGDDGTIYLVYSSADEEYLGSQYYRHLFGAYSPDNGTSWIESVELTPDLDIAPYEYVFPSMNRRVSDRLHITAMRDFEPGLVIRGDLDPADPSDIIYFSVTNDLVSIKEVSKLDVSKVEVYPNPTTGQFTIKGNDMSNTSIAVYNNIGQQLFKMKTRPGITQQQLDLSKLSNGLYTIMIGEGKNTVSKNIMIEK